MAETLETQSLARDHQDGECAIAEMTRPVPAAKGAPAQIDPRYISLDREDALLFVCDVQERLVAAMDRTAVEMMTKNIRILLRAAKRLGLPVITSEQYTKGLGPTIAPLAELIEKPAMEKLEFSAGNNEAIAHAVLEMRRRQVILVGMEAHVCIFQTARDLARAGFATFVVEDAVISRTETNRQLGFRLCERAGATLTGTEVVLFDLLVRGPTPEFRELAPLVR